jgi:hypothetical protein
MGIQTATTGNLASAQNIMIAQALYTAENNAPCRNLIQPFKLTKGQKQLTVPKVGQMTASGLTDGVDMVNSQDIGLTTTDLTTAEVGLKIIVTKKLIRQFNEDVFKMVGRQMGDAMARKTDTDVIALFSALNGGTAYGADNKYLSMINAQACVVAATANNFPSPVFIVHHPNAVGYLAKDAQGIGATYYMGVMQGFPEETLRNYWKIVLSGVPVFQDGNIAKLSGYDSGYGVIASRSAMCYVSELEPTTENEEDKSLRAYEVMMISDYGVFELDDSYGAPLQYEIGSLATNN